MATDRRYSVNPKTEMRTHVILPKDTVAEIDRRVGPRRRSQFLADAAQRELAHLALLERARAAAGSAAGIAMPWGNTAEEIAAWVNELRAPDTERDEQLESMHRRKPALRT
jgi:hypothetical protein